MADPIARILPWDSEHFGKKLARANLHRGIRADQLIELDRWLRTHEVQGVYLLCEDEPESFRSLVDAGFHLMDVRITFDRRLAPTTTKQAEFPGSLRLARPDDLEQLRPLAASSHRDSRFYQDPAFRKVDCDALYAKWIENSVRGWADAVFVHEDREGRLGGYISAHHDPEAASASIGIIALDADFRGRGLGSALVRRVCAWAREEQGAERCTVVTQARNIAAQRLYQKQGFLTRELGYWFHKHLE